MSHISMKTASETACTESAISDWLDAFQDYINTQEASIRVRNKFYMLCTATLQPSISMPVVRTIFKLSNHFNLSSQTRYTAIHLYDNFLSNYFWDLYKLSKVADQQSNSWQSICERSTAQTKLHLILCLQLASKMESQSTILTIPNVMSALRLLGIEQVYNKNTMLSHEFRVFKTVDFRIPLYTPFHCVELLLIATGLHENPGVKEICIDILDIAYLQHEKLHHYLESLMSKKEAKNMENKLNKRNLMALEANVLFLGSSVIVCSIFLMIIKEEVIRNIIIMLNSLTGIKCYDIWYMARILFTLIIE